MLLYFSNCLSFGLPKEKKKKNDYKDVPFWSSKCFQLQISCYVSPGRGNQSLLCTENVAYFSSSSSSKAKKQEGYLSHNKGLMEKLLLSKLFFFQKMCSVVLFCSPFRKKNCLLLSTLVASRGATFSFLKLIPPGNHASLWLHRETNTHSHTHMHTQPSETGGALDAFIFPLPPSSGC